MIRAIVKNGKPKPLDPLPPEWADGRELRVEPTFDDDNDDPEAIEAWAREMDEAFSKIDPEDAKRLQAALRERQKEAKEMARREMGFE